MTGELTARREARQQVQKPEAAQAIENVLIKGDLAQLTPDQRNTYYLRLCEVTGLNPLTQPFEYLTLNKRLVLYAKKACTDQLRSIHRISVVDMDQDEREGIYSVTVKVQNGDGRTDMDIGSVNVEGLKGENRANAIMKASTKAKRRATLSICGLGLLDETEVDTIPQAALEGRRTNVVVNPATGREIDLENANQQRKAGAWERFIDSVQGYVDANNLDGLKQWFSSDEIANYVAGWVFKDQAHEYVEGAIEHLEGKAASAQARAARTRRHPVRRKRVTNA